MMRQNFASREKDSQGHQSHYVIRSYRPRGPSAGAIFTAFVVRQSKKKDLGFWKLAKLAD